MEKIDKLIKALKAESQEEVFSPKRLACILERVRAGNLEKNHLTVVQNENVDMRNYSHNSQYPEYYGAHGDGIAYYDWPIACYNGAISNSGIFIDQGTADIEVFAPGDRIMNDYGLNPEATTDDVFYCSQLQIFLLKSGSTYYMAWNNSHLWNDPATCLARTDTVFSDISIVSVQTGKANRDSYVFVAGTGLVNILTTMTDDSLAIKSWLTANSGSGQTARLAPGRIYFVNSLSTSAPFHQLADESTIEGNGATVFCRMADAGTPVSGMEYVCVFLRILNAADVTINNLRIKALKDRDGGTPATSYVSRLSSSDSNIYGITIDNSPNAHINNLECKNLHSDIRFVQGEKIYVDGWKSTGVLNNGLGTTKTYINNADLTTAPYSAAGFHLFYGGKVSDEVYITNSRFRSGDGYQEVMITFHASQGTVPSVGTTRHIYFDNCTIEAGAMLRGNNDTLGRQWIHFRNCVLRKTYETQSDTSTIKAREYLLGLYAASFELEDCLVETGYGSFIGSASAGGENSLIIRNTSIYSKLDSANKPFVQSFSGSAETRNIWTNYPGHLGIDLDHDSLQLKLWSIDKRIANLFFQLMGSDYVPALTQAPDTPIIGDRYYNINDGKTYLCTNAGMATKMSIRIYVSTFPYTNSHSFSFSNGETIEAQVNAAENKEAVADAIIGACMESGYALVTTSGIITTTSWPPGKVMRYDDSSGNIYVLITSKAAGNFERSISPNTNTTTKLKDHGYSAYSSGNGANPTWGETATGGLTARVADLEARVAALEPGQS
ncbi:MAG: hypothetical protein IKI36_07545 [Prevotella sp.]|nr:hypothetical protein [Prevotella sp.]